MWDLSMVGLVIAFFAFSLVLVAACEGLRGGDR